MTAASHRLVHDHGNKCGRLFRVAPVEGVKLATAIGERWFCSDGCPLYEVFLRLCALDEKGKPPA